MSRRALRILMIVLTLIGVGIASYVTYVHYAGIKPACTAGESCTKVQTSIYSELAGVPVALMGLIGYIAILATLLAPESERTRFATLAFTVGGFGFSAYLTYRELFSIHAICEWCVTSAIDDDPDAALGLALYARCARTLAGRWICLRGSRRRRRGRQTRRKLEDPSIGIVTLYRRPREWPREILRRARSNVERRPGRCSLRSTPPPLGDPRGRPYPPTQRRA